MLTAGTGFFFVGGPQVTGILEGSNDDRPKCPVLSDVFFYLVKLFAK